LNHHPCEGCRFAYTPSQGFASLSSHHKTNLFSAKEQKMTDEKPRKTRLFFVDNLRILLIIMLVRYYLDGWPDDLTFLLATLFSAVAQAFYLAFFFMISGYFTPGSYDRKGSWSFLKDRLLRLGIPLLFYSASSLCNGRPALRSNMS
jgi:hypothetical protein